MWAEGLTCGWRGKPALNSIHPSDDRSPAKPANELTTPICEIYSVGVPVESLPSTLKVPISSTVPRSDRSLTTFLQFMFAGQDNECPEAMSPGAMSPEAMSPGARGACEWRCTWSPAPGDRVLATGSRPGGRFPSPAPFGIPAISIHVALLHGIKAVKLGNPCLHRWTSKYRRNRKASRLAEIKLSSCSSYRDRGFELYRGTLHPEMIGSICLARSQAWNPTRVGLNLHHHFCLKVWKLGINYPAWISDIVVQGFYRSRK